MLEQPGPVCPEWRILYFGKSYPISTTTSKKKLSCMLSRVLSHIGHLSALLPAYCGNLRPALGPSLPLPSDSGLVVRCAFWPVSLAILPLTFFRTQLILLLQADKE